VKPFSAQLAFLFVALLSLAVAASASTTKSHKHHSTKTASSKSHHVSKTSSHHGRHSKSRRARKASWKSKGQHGITSDRTRQIQEALIQQHYLDGEANGVWDSRTEEACRKYQADNGWQSKVTPDSRALIKLGLGPDHSNVLNPETAATSPYLPGGGVKSDAMAPPATAVQVPEQ
jgi:hypothetical protein